MRRTSFRPHGGDDCLPYTLIFFDPPYRTTDEISPGRPLSASLKRLAKDSISTRNAVLVLRTPEHFETPEIPGWNVHDCWEISSMMIWILTKPGAFSEDDPDEVAPDENVSENDETPSGHGVNSDDDPCG